MPPGCNVTWYPVTGEPLLDAGGRHATAAVVSVREAAT
jgi:hypothetical protein